MRKLWNRPNLPVWSLVTTDVHGQANMNICTYVSAVSMEPKLMLVAVYNGTKTLANLEKNQTKPVLLQLLTEELAPVVRVCGKQSGFAVDKVTRLRKRYEIGTCEDLPYFTKAAGYLRLAVQTMTAVGGDHVLYTFAVLEHKNISAAPVLTTDFLRSQKIIR